MAENSGWMGAVELQQELMRVEAELTAANDRIADLERVRRTALLVTREWPSLREKIDLPGFQTDLLCFTERIHYLKDAVEGRTSMLPPPMENKPSDEEYLKEVLLEVWGHVIQWREGPAIPGSASGFLAQIAQILEVALEPTTVKVLHPVGHSYKTPVLGSPPSGKPIRVQRLRCEDDGPEYPDGLDGDGFPGGNGRFALPPPPKVPVVDYSERMVPRFEPTLARKLPYVEEPVMSGPKVGSVDSRVDSWMQSFSSRLREIELALGLK